MSKAWMPMYWGDLIADTMDLGPAEFGIYMRLLAHCWQHGSIPDDDRKLALISHCDTRLWRRYRASVLQFFDTPCDAKMQHTRVTKELLRYEEISSKRKDAALQMHFKKHASATQSQSQSPRRDKAKALSLLPDDWEPNVKGLAFVESKGWAREKTREEIERFKDHAKANNRKQADWDAAWRNWVTSPYQGKANGNGHGRPRTLFERNREMLTELYDAERKAGARAGSPFDRPIPKLIKG